MDKDIFEWEHRFKEFAEILHKLEDQDLQTLTFIFDCYPHDIDHITKHDYLRSLWGTFRDLKVKSADSLRLRAALSVLR